MLGRGAGLQQPFEEVLRKSIAVLVEKLIAGEGLKINDLGRFWVEEKPPTVIVSNLGKHPEPHRIEGRKVVRFRASSRIVTELNSDDNNL